MMLKIQLCITEINYIFKCITTENCYFKLQKYLAKLIFLVYFLNAVLVYIRDLFIKKCMYIVYTLCAVCKCTVYA